VFADVLLETLSDVQLEAVVLAAPPAMLPRFTFVLQSDAESSDDRQSRQSQLLDPAVVGDGVDSGDAAVSSGVGRNGAAAPLPDDDDDCDEDAVSEAVPFDVPRDMLRPDYYETTTQPWCRCVCVGQLPSLCDVSGRAICDVLLARSASWVVPCWRVLRVLVRTESLIGDCTRPVCPSLLGTVVPALPAGSTRVRGAATRCAPHITCIGHKRRSSA
jgi:hypothetical protein